MERFAQMSSLNSVTTKAVKGMAKSQIASFSDEMKTDSALEVNDFGGWKRSAKEGTELTQQAQG